MALCEDTGGSCRMPASANGIYGFRPSLGCYNFSTGMGLVPAEFTRDTIGEMHCSISSKLTLQLLMFPQDCPGMQPGDYRHECVINDCSAQSAHVLSHWQWQTTSPVYCTHLRMLHAVTALYHVCQIWSVTSSRGLQTV